MKAHKRLKKAAAFVLSTAMILTVPGISTQAAELNVRGVTVAAGFWDSITDFFSGLFGGGKEDAGTYEGTELELVTDETTVSDATELRASTYRVADDRAQSIVYFPVTLFDYDKDTINDLILKEEAEAAVEAGQSRVDYWKGLYFSSGDPQNDKMPTSVEVESENSQTTYDEVIVQYSGNGNYDRYEDGTYYLDRQGQRRVTNIECDREWRGIGPFGYYEYTWTVTYNSGYTQTFDESSITLYHAVTTGTETITSNGYAGYNYWTGNAQAGSRPNTGVSSGDETRGYIYSGLVADTLDNSGNIQFNVPDGGIFNVRDTSSKEVYTNIGLPFEYDSDTGYYTFDSDEMAAYFADEPVSGSNLAYSDTPAAFHYSSESSYNTGFFPFNTLKNSTVNATNSEGDNNITAHPVSGTNSSGDNVDERNEENKIRTGNDAANFWFGMTANIPFTMNPNGKITSSEESADAEFTFSGDDDVWVFVDGQLVLDLGGIHDSVSGSFNFAENTIEMWSTNDNNNSGDVAGNYGSGSGTVTQGQLFNVLDEEGEVVSQGKLNTDINTFCATDEHTLTIYYLERGGGLSNNKIQFNLPQRDSLSVSKVISTVDSEGVELTQKQQETANLQLFGYTLYDGNNQPMKNQGYSLYSSAGTFLGNGSTNSYGQFSIRNGQTARFYGLTFTGENTYYVVEDAVSGYETPAWSVEVTGNEGYGHTEESGYTSDKITISGEDEATETVSFTCTNTLTHVDGTSVTPQNDERVVDYGLPIEIDVLANDQYTGGSLTLDSVSGGKFGTAEIVDNKLVYTLTGQLTDVDVLTYTAKVDAGNGVDVKTATAEVRIIPATSMYYEEDFSGLVTYTDGKSSRWQTTGTAQKDYQESDIVGSTSDSPYGTDAAYLNNSGDSYGTSKWVADTTNGAAQFSYEFTGTGTTVFARMTKNTGYLQIKLSQGDKLLSTTYRDTKILGDTVETLYNVPIYDNQDLDYGTYKLTITIAKAGTPTNTDSGAGKEFYVDGIRIYQPMDTASSEYDTAQDAYLRDAESNVMVAQVRDKLLKEYTVDNGDSLEWSTENGFVTFTDTNGEMTTAAEYSSIGPKNETYLNDGQSISFSLAKWNSNAGKVYLGIKAPTGSGQVRIGTTTLDINNTVDSYYDISTLGTVREVDGEQVVTFNITAVPGSLISVTNIKVTGIADFVIVAEDNIDVGEDGDIEVQAEAENKADVQTEEPVDVVQKGDTE